MKLTLLMLIGSAAFSQVATLPREQLENYTAKSTFDRFSDGRPKVPDDMLKRLETVSAPLIGTVLPGDGFVNQWASGFRVLHPGRKLIGRVVTAQFMPLRPDVYAANELDARAKGVNENGVQRVLDMLQPGDVLVVDLFGKVENGTLLDANLASYIYAVTKTGFVVDGSIRDPEGISKLDLSVYFRGTHPSILRNVMLTGINVPVRIGETTVLPGDVAYGDSEGVFFIPPYLVEKIILNSDLQNIRDQWTKEKFLSSGTRYKSSDIFENPRDQKLRIEFQQFVEKKMRELHPDYGKNKEDKDGDDVKPPAKPR